MPHWLVIDLEATTAEGGWPLEEMEIIEIGATLVAAADARELDHFQRFVRPVRRPLLTHFCRDLTHISQANVDGAAHLDTVWEASSAKCRTSISSNASAKSASCPARSA